MLMWNALFSFIDYVGANVIWDSMKTVGNFVWQEKELFHNLFYDSFMKAIEKHASCYDETALQMLKLLKREIKHNRENFVYWVESISYEDLGNFIDALRNKEFQKMLSESLISFYDIDCSGCFEIMPNIIEDVFSFYRISIVSCVLKSKKKDELILLQVLKIDEILVNIEEFLKQTAILPEMKNELDKIINYITNTNEIAVSATSTENVLAENKKNEVLVNKVRKYFEERKFICTEIYENCFQAESHRYFGYKIFIKCPSTKKKDVLIREVQDFFISRNGDLGLVVVDDVQYKFLLENEVIEQKLIKIITFDDLIGENTSLIEYVDLISQQLEMPDFFIDEFYGIIDGRIVDMVECIDSLVLNDEIRKVAILGDYGTGKTTFCYFYLHYCIDLYHQNIFMRFPVFLDMTKYANQISLFEFALEEIKNKCLMISEFELRELIRLGKILIVVDGLESLTNVSFETVIRLIDVLGDIPSSKIILTARTHYFRSNMYQKRIKEYTTVYLTNWTLSDCKHYLMKRYNMEWKTVADKIFSSFHLYEIFQNPFFATELCNIIDKGMNRQIEIFEQLINSWVEKNYYLYLNNQLKLDIIEKVACLMYFSDVLDFSEQDLLLIIKSFGLGAEDAYKYKDDILTSSFFIRDSNDKYRFSHYSIMEFFVAKFLLKEIHGMLHQSIKPTYFSKKKLTLGIYQFLSEMVVDKELLIELVNRTRNQTFKETGYIGSNCISIMRCMCVDLIKCDFSHCVLVDADFRNMDLRESFFCGTDLYSSNFDNCILDSSNFIGANLAFSSIKEFSGIFDFIVLDSSNIYLATMQNSIYKYDMGNKSVKIITSLHNDSIWTLYQMENKSCFFSGGRDHRLIMWSNEGDLIRVFDGHADNIWKISSSPDNNYFASCSSDRTIKIWDIGSSSALFTLKRHTDVVRDIAFWNEQYLFSCAIDKKIICWNLITKKVEYEYICLNELRCMSILSNGVVVGDSCGNITIFDFQLNCLAEKKLHDVEIRSICYVSERRCIVTGDSSGRISIYYLNTGRVNTFNCIGQFINRIRVYQDKIYVVNYAGIVNTISYEGEILFSDNVNNLIYNTSNQFSCSKMKVSADVQLSESRKKFLLTMGAEIID